MDDVDKDRNNNTPLSEIDEPRMDDDLGFIYLLKNIRDKGFESSADNPIDGSTRKLIQYPQTAQFGYYFAR